MLSNILMLISLLMLLHRSQGALPVMPARLFQEQI
jgi:hypothetical protein